MLSRASRRLRGLGITSNQGVATEQDNRFALGWTAYFNGLPFDTETHGDWREGWQKAEKFEKKQKLEDKIKREKADRNEYKNKYGY